MSTGKVTAELQLAKRHVLRIIATVFDSLGFVGPFIVRAKMLLRE